MADVQYFWDTFALVQRQRGADSYAAFADAPVFTHEMNIYEFIAAILRDFDESTARSEIRSLSPNLLDSTTEDLFSAARFRAKTRVSYVDALGYTLARKNDMRFLTGDKAFKSVDGVEFVR